MAGVFDDLPPALRAAVKRALDNDRARRPDDTHVSLVKFVARAVWRAGIAHGRRLERAEMKREAQGAEETKSR